MLSLSTVLKFMQYSKKINQFKACIWICHKLLTFCLLDKLQWFRTIRTLLCNSLVNKRLSCQPHGLLSEFHPIPGREMPVFHSIVE